MHPKQYIEIKYEDIVSTPDKIIHKVSRYVRAKTTKYTSLIKADIWKTNPNFKKKNMTKDLSQPDIIEINKILREYGYKTI